MNTIKGAVVISDKINKGALDKCNISLTFFKEIFIPFYESVGIGNGINCMLVLTV